MYFFLDPSHCVVAVDVVVVVVDVSAMNESEVAAVCYGRMKMIVLMSTFQDEESGMAFCGLWLYCRTLWTGADFFFFCLFLFVFCAETVLESCFLHYFFFLVLFFSP